MSTVYVRFEIESFSADDGFAVCEFVDGEPVRQVTVVGDRMVTSLEEEDPDFGMTLTDQPLEPDWRDDDQGYEEVDRDYFERMWAEAVARQAG
ncbi:hypothetical protein [Lentzea terrae]|uniref:hypothetical protein n=1 Tax=Lentzea terrae TaxID=2200761 RepID=UPI000DD39363|nr:hypothetical protein [Lentzea terrae]